MRFELRFIRVIRVVDGLKNFRMSISKGTEVRKFIECLEGLVLCVCFWFCGEGLGFSCREFVSSSELVCRVFCVFLGVSFYFELVKFCYMVCDFI